MSDNSLSSKDKSKSSDQDVESRNQRKVFVDFMKTLLIPLLINKAFMLYFGINYSSNPGQGYGYGLIATVVILVGGLVLFFWKYRNVEDP